MKFLYFVIGPPLMDEILQASSHEKSNNAICYHFHILLI